MDAKAGKLLLLAASLGCLSPALKTTISLTAVGLSCMSTQLQSCNLAVCAGHHLAQLPMDAKAGKLLLLAASLGCLSPALTIAACLSHRTPFASDLNSQDRAGKAQAALASTSAPQSALIC